MSTPAPAVGTTEQIPEQTPELASPWRQRLRAPLVTAAFLTIVGLAFKFNTRPDLDASWVMGLTMWSSERPGDVLYTYGPLGFLAQSTEITRLQPLLALGYAVAVCGAYSTSLTLLARRWMGPIATLLAGLMLVLAWGWTVALGEQAIAAAILLTALLLPPIRATQPRGWVFVAAGCAAAFHLLVKFNAGPPMLLLSLVLAVAWRGRPKNLLLVALGFGASLFGLWVATGQVVGQLGYWITGSLQIAAGYSSAMAESPPLTAAIRYLSYLVPVLGVTVLGAALWLVRERWRGLPVFFVMAVGSWEFVKTGLVGLGPGKAGYAYMGVGTIAFAAPWLRRERFLPLAAVVVAFLGVLQVTTVSPWNPTGLPGAARSALQSRREAAESAGFVLRSAVDPAYHGARLAQKRAAIRRAYGVPTEVTTALAGRRVHVEPWDIAAVWAERLEWSPLPVLQSLAAYTANLDDRNVKALLDPTGPDGVLYQRVALGGRYWLWETPATQLALTCTFEAIADGAGAPQPGRQVRWFALVRREDVCGRPRPLGRVVAHPGEVVSIPAPRVEGNLVVASIELPRAALERLITFVAKPRDRPAVEIDGVRYRLITGAADQPHLVRVPRRVAGRVPPPGAIAHRQLRVFDVRGDVTVRFAEIPVV